jgi:hypothetical protein
MSVDSCRGLLHLLGAAFLLGACGKSPAPPTRSSAATAPDSLALAGPGGVEVWFTLARSGRSSEGVGCVERGLEIRRGGTRRRVPLLYTAEAPSLLDDSTMRAILWTDCRPVATYRVNLITGQPVREQGNSPAR